MRAAIAHGPRPAGRPRKPACRSCYDSRASDGQYDVRLECHQFGCILAHGCGIARAPAIVDADILPDRPTRLLQRCRAAEQRDEVASFQSIELHLPPRLWPPRQHTALATIKSGLAAVRDLDPANVRLGSVKARISLF